MELLAKYTFVFTEQEPLFMEVVSSQELKVILEKVNLLMPMNIDIFRQYAVEITASRNFDYSSLISAGLTLKAKYDLPIKLVGDEKVTYYIDEDHSEVYGKGRHLEYRTLVEMKVDAIDLEDNKQIDLDEEIIEQLLRPDLFVEDRMGFEYWFEESPEDLREIFNKKGFIESKVPMDY